MSELAEPIAWRWPDFDDRATLRHMFGNQRAEFEDSYVTTEGDQVTGKFAQHKMQLRREALRPPKEIQRSIGFLVYWAWLFVWAEMPLVIPAGVIFVAALGGIRLYAAVASFLR